MNIGFVSHRAGGNLGMKAGGLMKKGETLEETSSEEKIVGGETGKKRGGVPCQEKRGDTPQESRKPEKVATSSSWM